MNEDVKSHPTLHSPGLTHHSRCLPHLQLNSSQNNKSTNLRTWLKARSSIESVLFSFLDGTRVLFSRRNASERHPGTAYGVGERKQRDGRSRVASVERRRERRGAVRSTGREKEGTCKRLCIFFLPLVLGLDLSLMERRTHSTRSDVEIASSSVPSRSEVVVALALVSPVNSEGIWGILLRKYVKDRVAFVSPRHLGRPFPRSTLRSHSKTSALVSFCTETERSICFSSLLLSIARPSPQSGLGSGASPPLPRLSLALSVPLGGRARKRASKNSNTLVHHSRRRSSGRLTAWAAARASPTRAHRARAQAGRE